MIRKETNLFFIRIVPYYLASPFILSSKMQQCMHTRDLYFWTFGLITSKNIPLSYSLETMQVLIPN